MLKAIEAVQAVEAFITVQEAWRFYQYQIHPELSKTGTCPICQALSDLLMTRREAEARFPDLEKISDNLWIPHVHPNCKCELHFEEEEEEEDVRKDKRWKYEPKNAKLL